MGIIEQLRKVVVTDNLDLSELDGSYTYQDEEGDEHPIKLPFRLNWTRGLKERRRDLRKETFAVQNALRELDSEDKAKVDELNERAEAVTDQWAAWWADVLMMGVDEVEALKDAIPDGHWDWITGQIVRHVSEYELDAVKKASVRPSRTGEEQEASPQNS